MASQVRRLKITIVADNVVASGAGVLGEHGLALHVEADGQAFLFDTGQSGIAIGNAARLGVNLGAVETVVLSHGHYDHTGGLAVFTNAFGPHRIVAHPGVFESKYATCKETEPRRIGCPVSTEYLARRGAALHLEAGPQELGPGLMTTGAIAQTTDFEHIPSSLAVRTAEGFRPDQFEDEQAIVVTTDQGLVVVVGCSHRGVVNTLQCAQQLTGEERVLALIGGTHLVAASEDQLDGTVDELRRLDVEHIVACHCTGFKASVRLANEFGDRFNIGGVGYFFAL